MTLKQLIQGMGYDPYAYILPGETYTRKHKKCVAVDINEGSEAQFLFTLGYQLGVGGQAKVEVMQKYDCLFFPDEEWV